MHKSLISLMSILCVFSMSIFTIGCEDEEQVNGTEEVQEVNTDYLSQCSPGEVKSCGQGNCYGTITCPDNGVWPSEDVCAYPAELCDGFDNDCDGTADEDFANLGNVCSSNEELCGANGVYVCNDQLDDVVCAVDSNTENKGAEICDGEDNDCDGNIDENFNIGTECNGGFGVCTVTGTLVCDDEGGTTCSAEEDLSLASDEVCDGKDNDCDGSTDEEIDSSTLSEDCDGEDNDCDGRIDEDFTVNEACFIGEGLCASEGVYECTRSGRGVVCIAGSTGDPSPETCNDIDDDCDGRIDEDFNANEACYAGEGLCQGEGVYVCNEDQNGSTCTAVANPAAQSTEECNGVDDDCDGTVDENRSFMIDVRDADDNVVRVEYKTLTNNQVSYHAVDTVPVGTNDSDEPSLDEIWQYYFDEDGHVSYADLDIDGNGRIDYRHTMIYENGKLMFREVTEVRGTIVLERWFYIYNMMHQLVRIDKDGNADGSIEFEVHYVYNADGHVEREETRDVINNVVSVVSYQYNDTQHVNDTTYAENDTELYSEIYSYNEQHWVSSVERFEADVVTQTQNYEYQCTHLND